MVKVLGELGDLVILYSYSIRGKEHKFDPNERIFKAKEPLLEENRRYTRVFIGLYWVVFISFGCNRVDLGVNMRCLVKELIVWDAIYKHVGALV